MSSTAVTTESAHLAVRAHELIAQWNAEEAQTRATIERHYAWVEHMVTVERIRRETLPCHHGTSFWPDRGQVCCACENESDYEAEPLTAAQIMSHAMEQARCEFAAAAPRLDPRSSQPGGDPWAIDDDLPPF